MSRDDHRLGWEQPSNVLHDICRQLGIHWFLDMMHNLVSKHLLRSAVTVPTVMLVTGIAFMLHARALSSGLICLVLVMLVAFRWGFVEAVIASIAAAACLDFFYMKPIFSLYERDPQDWISSIIFITVALTAGHFANGIKQKAADTEKERTRLEKLYLTSRDVLVLDRREGVGSQLTRLIANVFKVDAVAVWDARELRMDQAGKNVVPEDEVRGTYYHELSENDLATGRFKRVLRLGTRPIGALYIACPPEDCQLDPRSVDAIASLSAIALERANSFMAESIAEAAKRSEQLRSTILDGLAHAFKTPLATIQSASSGLLDLNRLEGPERELLSLIDEETTRLTKLTNQVLQTAKLDEAQLKLQLEKVPLEDFLEIYGRETTNIVAGHTLRTINEASREFLWADVRLLQMALLQILDNASKYGSPASPITFRIMSTDTEVIFSVQNDGSFMPPEERLRVFERFYRSPGSQHRAAGTGIGLSVTKRIAEAHRGRVWVESDPHYGTTFFLALPHICKEN